MDINNGIQISGGTNTIGNMVVGKGAKAIYHNPSQSTNVDEQQLAIQQKAKIAILLVFANPLNRGRLVLGNEGRAIKEAIKLSRSRDNIALTECYAATIHDLRRALLEEEFHIIHFGGHGTPEGLIMEDEQGQAYPIPPHALAELFATYEKSLRCVILNACYSIQQGQLISSSIPYTIAVDGTIHDKAAIEFARGFYDAIGSGKNIEFSYEEGRRSARLAASEQNFTSVLFKR